MPKRVATPVKINGVQYASFKEAGEALGVGCGVVSTLVKRRGTLDIRDYVRRPCNSIEFEFEGKVYPSIAEARRQNGISRHKMEVIREAQKDKIVKQLGAGCVPGEWRHLRRRDK